VEASGEPLEIDDDLEHDAASGATSDPAIAAGLDAPSTPQDLYLEEASVYRPIATGDIFRGVVGPGFSESPANDLTMLLAHPSAMRRGAELELRARATPVVTENGLSRRKWAKGSYDVFPLPLLASVAKANGFEIEDRGWGADLGLAAPIKTKQLDVRLRVACLSPQGIHLLLQRLVHADTRVAVRLDTLAQTFAAKLEEIEMLQTWNEEIVAPKVDSGGDLLQELSAQARDFDSVMNETTTERPVSLRQMLERRVGAIGQAGEAHRLFAAELAKRRPA